MSQRTEYQCRITALRAAMSERGVDLLLAVAVFPEKEGHVAYLTGHRLWTPQWPTGRGLAGVGYGFLLVTPQVCELYATRIDEDRVPDIVTARVVADDTIGAVAQRFTALKGEAPRIGIAGHDILPARVAPSILTVAREVIDCDALLFGLRLKKSVWEQEILAEGAAIATAAIEAARAATMPGKSNGELAGAAVGRALAHGADHVLRCRLRSGPELRGARWPYASRRQVEDGDLVQIDLVGIHKNYLFDVSRVWIAGRERPVEADAIASAEALTKSLVETLTSGRSIAEASSQWLASINLPAPQRAILEGHSIGLDVVEPPWLVTDEDTVLSEGMVLCAEPSLVLAGGEQLKVEETVLVRDGASLVLSHM